MPANYQSRVGIQSTDRPLIDEGLRAYMLRVYNFMGSGLALTGIVAYTVANIPSIYNVLFGTGAMWVLIIALIGMVFFLSARINKMSVGAAQTSFWIFAALMGLFMSSIFVTYTGVSIARVFFITAGTFGAMSLYGYTTKRDLTGWGSFLMMGLIGMLIGMVVNWFLASAMLYYLVSAVGIIVFVGLTAYDTQRIKEQYYAGDSADIAGKKAIMGALRLYLDFINLFILLLSLFGQRR